MARKKKKKRVKNEVVHGVRWEDVGIDSKLPFEEKVRLYMDQMKDRADTLPVDDAEELPFD